MPAFQTVFVIKAGRAVKARSYRPGNGTEGMTFDANYCDRCTNQPINPADGGCNIIALAMCFEQNEPEYPPEWVLLMGEPGETTGITDAYPFCTAFKKRERGKPREEPVEPDPRQYTLFE